MGLRCDKPTWDAGRTREKFSQHPAWVYCAGKPIEGVVYCLNNVIAGVFETGNDLMNYLILIFGKAANVA